MNYYNDRMCSSGTIRMTKIGIYNIQAFLLSLFIVLAPIYKCLNFITIFGFNILMIIVGLLFVTYLLTIPQLITKRERKFFAPLVATILTVELIIHSYEGIDTEFGMVIGVILCLCFAQTDSKINIKKLKNAYLLSIVLAAIFSISTGISQGSIVRAAIYVDGSIAPICIAILLFSEKEELPNSMLIKSIAFTAALIVAFFGMSRARLLLIAFLIMIFFGKDLWNSLINKKAIKLSSLLAIATIPFLIFISLQIPLVQNLLDMNVDRFVESGFSSSGRDDEMEYALKIFQENKIIGSGFGNQIFTNYSGSKVAYDNHCAYVAILARGGILLGVAFAAMLISLVKQVFKKKKIFLIVMLFVLLFLSYGNAGIFNYTICSTVILIVLGTKQEKCKDE